MSAICEKLGVPLEERAILAGVAESTRATSLSPSLPGLAP